MSLAAELPRPAALAARSVTAVAGGYLLAAAGSALLARGLPGPRVDATAWGLVVSFGLYAATLLWCFAEPRLLRVASVVWGGGAAALGLLLAAGGRL